MTIMRYGYWVYRAATRMIFVVLIVNLDTKEEFQVSDVILKLLIN